MKRKFVLLLTLLLIFTLSGCSKEKELTCEGSDFTYTIRVTEDEIVYVSEDGVDVSDDQGIVNEITLWFEYLGGENYLESIELAYDEETSDGFTCTLK